MHITKNSSYNLRFCSGEEETPMAFDAMGFAQEFGAQVRAVRKYEKITQMELAWMVGLSGKTIRDIERGLPGPSIGAVLKVAQELGIELAITNPLT